MEISLDTVPDEDRATTPGYATAMAIEVPDAPLSTGMPAGPSGSIPSPHQPRELRSSSPGVGSKRPFDSTRDTPGEGVSNLGTSGEQQHGVPSVTGPLREPSRRISSQSYAHSLMPNPSSTKWRPTRERVRGSGKKERPPVQVLPVLTPVAADSCLRAPLLAKQWVLRKSNGEPTVKHGSFPAVLVDWRRLEPKTLTQLQEQCGYSPAEHDVVVFFERERRQARIKGEYGAVVKNTSRVWSRAARDAARDRTLVDSLEHWWKEYFDWMQCDECGSWRYYPIKEVIFATDALFCCAMARIWNPLILNCDVEQEYAEEGGVADVVDKLGQQAHEAAALSGGESVASAGALDGADMDVEHGGSGGGGEETDADTVSE